MLNFLRGNSLIVSILACVFVDTASFFTYSCLWVGYGDQATTKTILVIISILAIPAVISLAISSFHRENNPSNDFGTGCVLTMFLICQILITFVFSLPMLFLDLEIFQRN
jgi:hypothetical protein